MKQTVEIEVPDGKTAVWEDIKVYYNQCQNRIMENTNFREDLVIEFNDELDTEEGRNFIYKAVDFFVNRGMDKAKDSVFKPLKTRPAKVYYEKYKFIYDRKGMANMELCYRLVNSAAQYLYYIEDTLDPEIQFPFDCTYLFDLEKWYDEIDIRHRSNDEILILLINKLYNSSYYDLLLY